MPKRAKALGVKEVERLAKRPGMHAVGGSVAGLCLHVREVQSGFSAQWVLRIRKEAIKRKATLGPYPLMGLAEARQAAAEYMKSLALGADPREEKKAAQAAQEAARREAERAVFTIDALLPEWLAWKALTAKLPDDYARREASRIRNHLGGLLTQPLPRITADDVAAALRPTWCAKPATADKNLGHLHDFFSWAVSEKKCLPEGTANPADKSTVRRKLPAESKRKQGRNQPALSLKQHPSFFKALNGKGTVGARCLAFAILTVSRSENAREIKWEQISEDGKLWTIPAQNMKTAANGQHMVPLSPQARAIIEAQRAVREEGCPYVFPSPYGRGHKPLSDSTLTNVIRKLHLQELSAGRQGWIDPEQTAAEGEPVLVVPHGVARAAFSTWAHAKEENSNVIELCMHHSIDRRYKGAYNRAKMLEQKRALLEAWGEFCCSEI